MNGINGIFVFFPTLRKINRKQEARNDKKKAADITIKVSNRVKNNPDIIKIMPSASPIISLLSFASRKTDTPGQRTKIKSSGVLSLQNRRSEKLIIATTAPIRSMPNGIVFVLISKREQKNKYMNSTITVFDTILLSGSTTFTTSSQMPYL